MSEEILNTSTRDAIYQFSHIRHDQYRYRPNTYKIGYKTQDLTELRRYNPGRNCDVLPSRKEIIIALKEKCDPIQYSKQMIQKSYYFNNYRRYRYSDNNKHIKYVYNDEFSDDEKSRLTLKFNISGYLRGILDEYLDNNWKILRTVYDEFGVTKYKYPKLHDDIFKILSLYVVDYEEYRYLYPPLTNEYKLWINSFKILPLQTVEWKKWVMNYLLKTKLQKPGYNVTKTQNKKFFEQIKNGTFEDFDSDTQHLWSQWIVNQCVASGTNKKIKAMANFYFKFYQGRIFPKDFKIIFDFYQDNIKMLKILARYPFYTDSKEWIDRFKSHDFLNEDAKIDGDNIDQEQAKEYKKWRFLMDSLIKNYNSYSTKQLYKKSIVKFLKQMFVELIIATENEQENENENEDEKKDDENTDLLWKNMTYLMNKIVHGSSKANNKYFFLSNHFDQILRYNNIKVLKWCIDDENNFMDPLIIIKRPEYFDKTLEFIQEMVVSEAKERLDLFKQFIKWNFESILYHKNKRIVNKWIDGIGNNNVMSVYSEWIKQILHPEWGKRIHPQYAQCLTECISIIQQNRPQNQDQFQQ